MYADDIAFIPTDPGALQDLLGKCEEHARQQIPIQCCQMWIISASDVEFKIDQQAPALEPTGL